MAHIAPSANSPAVLDLTHRIVPGGAATWVRVDTQSGALRDECFDNVAKAIEESGGNIVYGWIIRLIPGVLIEAEFHAVQMTTTGSLRCVSPHEPGVDWILFLADPDRTYQGSSVDSVRVRLAGAPTEVDELIRLKERQFQLVYTKPGSVVKLKGSEAAEHARIVQELSDLAPRLDSACGLPHRNEECCCGSGKKFKKCCMDAALRENR